MQLLGSLDHHAVVFAMLSRLVGQRDISGVDFLLELLGSVCLQLLLQIEAVLGTLVLVCRDRGAGLTF